MSIGKLSFKEKVDVFYSWVISWYPAYVVVAVVLTPFVAYSLLSEDKWWSEFKYSVFRRRTGKL